MAHILFTMADVEMAQFRRRPISYEIFDEQGVRRDRPIPQYSDEGDQVLKELSQRTRDRQAFEIKTGRKVAAAGRRIGAGATYLRRTASGALTAVRNNPGKTALIAAGLAAAATAGGYLLNKGKKKRKQDYSRQIRTVYFSRRNE